MGFLTFLKRMFSHTSCDMDSSTQEIPPSERPIPEDEQQYYRDEKYYTGGIFADAVVSFEERKKSTYPSKRGLYVPEILLLKYCTYGTYPHPRHGYPGFWWFEYGIRNVGAVLESLEARGFICYVPAKEGLSKLTVAQLKEMLLCFNLPTDGKKLELIKLLQDNVSETDLAAKMPSRKYMLTEKGRQELEENEYVPYMHDNKYKTNAFASADESYTVWDMNKDVHEKPQWDWKSLIVNRERQLVQIQGDRIPFEKLPTTSEPAAYRDAYSKKNNLQHLQGYTSAGIGKYIFLATLDLKTCPICAKRDMRRYSTRDLDHLPPCHEGCRCTTMCDMSDEQIGRVNRFARDPVTGKGMYVPGGTSYREWHKKYVETNPVALQNEKSIRIGQAVLSERERRVYEIIRGNPGILQSKLPEQLPDLSKSAISYATSRLVELKYIEKQPSGRSYCLYPMDVNKL